MPHLFTNRIRQYRLDKSFAEAHKGFKWESINAIVYCLGGFIFIVGSVLFLPRYEKFADWGAWAFIVGSVFYLLVTFHDLLESIQYFRSHQREDLYHIFEFLAATAYVTGTILFILGSVLFLPSLNKVNPAGWCFIIGSLLFVAGACINVLQIIQAGSLLTLQLLNATAICFIVGSVLFLASSVPLPLAHRQ